MKKIPLIIALVLIGAFALVFAVLNGDRVAVELALFRVAAPLGLVIVVAFAAGILLGVLWRVAWVADLLGERGRLRRALRLAEAEARAARTERHDA